jgi:hypothetical protein
MGLQVQIICVVLRNVLQKLFDNAFVRDPEVHESFHWAKSIWNAFLVQGLGLIPIIESDVHELSQKKGAFELLRVRSRLANAVTCDSHVRRIVATKSIRRRESAGRLPRY